MAAPHASPTRFVDFLAGALGCTSGAPPDVTALVRCGWRQCWSVLTVLVCTVLALVSPAAGAAQAAQAAQAVQAVQAKHVAGGAWFVQGEAALGSVANRNYISNAGFIVTSAGVVVVDALGSPALAKELLAAIRRVTAQPVRYVIVTHYHADHIYGLQVFKDLGATVIAQREGQAYLGSDTAQWRLVASRAELFPWIDKHTRLVAADR